MGHPFVLSLMLIAVLLVVLSAQGCIAARTRDLGNGFADHGVAAPISNSRGLVSTVDDSGRGVVLVWLHDHRGGYALLMVDAETGKAEEHPMPFDFEGDTPFASILTPENKLYTHFGSHFVEFDPVKRAFTFCHETLPQMAMSMTQDDNGVVWSVTYPKSGIVSFNPKTRELRDYGYVHTENWPQYQRFMAADDAGWIYFSIGSTRSQFIAFDPTTGKAKALLSDSERADESSQLYRDLDGKVYGTPTYDPENNWYELYKGQARRIGVHRTPRPKPFIAGFQDMSYRQFPDGRVLKSFDLDERTLSVEDPNTGKTTQAKFDYSSEGAETMSCATAPDGTICGGTSFPTYFFSYNQKTDALIIHPCYEQWNTLASQGGRLFVGSYPRGSLQEWDPARSWAPTEAGKVDSNPVIRAQCKPAIGRPHRLYAYPDGNTIIMGGTPDYGKTGGGLYFWDRRAGKGTLLAHTQVLPDHSTFSLVALPGGKLLGGTTIGAGTGGETKAKEAQLYIMDLASKRVEWHEAVMPGVATFLELCPAPGGLVYGMAGGGRFFVFDPTQRKIVHQEDVGSRLGPITTTGQGPRIFVTGPDSAIYILFVKGIAQVEAKTCEVRLIAKSPIPISVGGDYLDGRIYFISGSHLCSYKLGSGQ